MNVQAETAVSLVAPVVVLLRNTEKTVFTFPNKAKAYFFVNRKI